jgi:hypothetical protein
MLTSPSDGSGIVVSRGVHALLACHGCQSGPNHIPLTQPQRPGLSGATVAIWASSGTLSPCGQDAPAGFSAKSTLVSAVQYVAPSKSMVKAKSDAELRQVFTDAE